MEAWYELQHSQNQRLLISTHFREIRPPRSARKKAVDDIVQEGEKRKELLAAFTKVSAEAEKAKRQIADLRGNIRRLESYKEQFRPFPVIEGAIAIHPIQWVSGK